MYTLMDLPDHMVVELLQYLPYRDWIQYSLTHPNLQALIDQHLWRAVQQLTAFDHVIGNTEADYHNNCDVLTWAMNRLSKKTDWSVQDRHFYKQVFNLLEDMIDRQIAYFISQRTEEKQIRYSYYTATFLPKMMLWLVRENHKMQVEWMLCRLFSIYHCTIQYMDAFHDLAINARLYQAFSDALDLHEPMPDAALLGLASGGQIQTHKRRYQYVHLLEKMAIRAVEQRQYAKSEFIFRQIEAFKTDPEDKIRASVLYLLNRKQAQPLSDPEEEKVSKPDFASKI